MADNDKITITLDDKQVHNLKVMLEVALKTMGGPGAEFYLEMMHILKAAQEQ